MWVIAVGACVPPLEGYSGEYHARGVALECVDIVVTSSIDNWLPEGPVVAYQFGNRCEHRARVDLGAVRVIATAADGTSTQLSPIDPKSELRAAWLPAYADGSERIAYFANRAPARLCVDVSAVARSNAHPTPTCFDNVRREVPTP